MMKRLLAFTSLMMLAGSILIPAHTVSAQSGPDICAAAANGEAIPGYEVVYGRGDSGNQVVLGDDGDDDLRGGSGNDILCGFGGNDVLRGNSGNDILVDGETNKGGSGNDTEMMSPAEPENTDCALARTYQYPQNTPDLSGLRLVDCNLSGADLIGANLSGTDLTNARLTLAALFDVNLLGADLSGADLLTPYWGNTTCPDGTNSDYVGGTCLDNLSLD